MIDPYENILIGNFLYSIGLLLGSKSANRQLPGCINLLQQTPMDGPLGDVYLAYPGVVRLIEFKRESNQSTKEQAKLLLLRSALKRAPALENVSRTVHWYIESRKAPLEWTTAVTPYLDMDHLDAAPVSVRQFIEQLVEKALSSNGPEFEPQLIADYLYQVGKYAGTKGTTSSGMIVMLTSDGTLRYVALENIRDMRLDLRLQKEATSERAREVDMQRQAEQRESARRARQHSLGLERDRGFSR